MILPTGSSATDCENARHARNASVGRWSPVGRNVLHHACEPPRILADVAKPDQPAPVLAEQRDVTQPQPVEEGRHPVDMPLVRVDLALDGLVRATEAGEVRGDHPQPRVHEAGDHRPVEKAPRRLTVQAQHDRAIAWAFVQVRNTELREL